MKKKRWILIIAAYFCGAAVLAAAFFLTSVHRVYGWDPFAGTPFSQTDAFGSSFANEIRNMEYWLNQVLMSTDEARTRELETLMRNNWSPEEKNFRYAVRVTYQDGSVWDIYNAQPLADGTEKKGSLVYYRCLLNSPPDTNIPVLTNYWFHVNADGKQQVEVTVWMDDFSINDYMAEGKRQYDRFVLPVWFVSALGLAAVSGLMTLLVVMLRQEKRLGRKRGNPFYLEEEALLLLFAAAWLRTAIQTVNWVWFAAALAVILPGAGWLLFSALCQLCCSNGQRGKWITARLLRAELREKFTLAVQLAVLTAAAVFARYSHAFLMQRMFGWSWSQEEATVLYPFYLLFAGIAACALHTRLDQQELERVLAAIGSGADYGEMEFKTRRYQRMGEQLKTMSVNIRAMVEQNIRAERLKVDLITNVSHDLKTPLTSIITYIRLLEKEGVMKGKSGEYLAVLSDKANQLKRLTEDLLDAAKITSGNETIVPECLHFGEMVLQANGEFAERMEEKQLELVSSLENETMDAWIDGPKTWRILTNLYGNVCKYAHPGTRVYVDVAEKDGKVRFTMKNISHAPLNVPAKELMERFVQGDPSRSSGGNGLGLAIAGDLAKLQGGRLEIQIIGDLFLAELSLPAARSQETAGGQEKSHDLDKQTDGQDGTKKGIWQRRKKKSRQN